MYPNVNFLEKIDSLKFVYCFYIKCLKETFLIFSSFLCNSDNGEISSHKDKRNNKPNEL